MEIIELNHLALHVMSVDASACFYGEVLGLPVIPRPDFPFPGAWFRIGREQELHLIGGRLAGRVTESSRGGHFAMRVPDIEAAARRLREKGIAFRGPAPRPDGMLQIFFEDPDGHVVEFCGQPG
jgi:lactoylglutathione lyase